MKGNNMIIYAPAKINLTLEVLGKRADGYHDIRSVIQTISLCDEITFELSKVMEYKSDLPGWMGEKSLAAKTVELLRQTTGCKKDVSIFVKKRIPLVAGLGGDSSNAGLVIAARMPSYRATAAEVGPSSGIREAQSRSGGKRPS